MNVRGLEVNIKESDEYYHTNFTFGGAIEPGHVPVTWDANFKKRIDNVIHYLGEEGFFDAEKMIKIYISQKKP